VVVRTEMPRTAHVYRWRVDRRSGILPVGNGRGGLKRKLWIGTRLYSLMDLAKRIHSSSFKIEELRCECSDVTG